MGAVEPTSLGNAFQQEKPQAPAPKAPPVSAFEYLIEDYEHAMSVENLTARLNALGGEGWRIVEWGPHDTTTSRALFIRER